MSKREKVVVTGAAGFVGSHLCRALVEEFDVIALNTTRERELPQEVTFIQADCRDTKKLQDLFQGVTYVFHAAALPRVQYSIEYPLETHDVNVSGTLSVLFAAKESGVKKVVYSASSSAYGNQDEMPLREDMPARPMSPYGLQKYTGELYSRMFSEVYNLPTVSLRYFNVYGPEASTEGAYALVIAKFLKQRLEGKPMTITGDGGQTRDFTHVRDIVRANILAAKSPKVGKGEVINIGAGRNASVNQIAALIGGPVEYIPARLEPHDTLADNQLAKKLLGWKPIVSLEDGIAELKKLHGIR